MSLSTHVLDVARGRPVAGVGITLSLQKQDRWVELQAMRTDADGRVKQMLPESAAMAAGVYRIRFETAAYFAEQGVDGLYPWVEIVFSVAEGQGHYHIPLLLTANGYTTYRGS